ncbi:hypothetical protein DFJ75_3482 [Williamsia muralis]|uniref:Restriction endonuclease n=1 Tax=Williamsia marianensis TaxID=85044 RepID=A0A495K7Z4_WILMA|nr:hypothetical protein [Williamsia muralis]RKR96629.1 hypothetical protein DFJ75_3482 [Williamsia muralis]
MKPRITRRDVIDRLKCGFVDRGFADVSTRRGKLDQTFHIDGERIIGRGTVSQSTVGVEDLQRIHDEVYTLGRMKDKVRVHATYGAYSLAAVRYAATHRICLYTFDQDGHLTSVLVTPVLHFAAKIAQVSLGLLLAAAVVTCLVLGILWLSKGVDIGAGIGIVFLILTGFVVATVSAVWTALTRNGKKK